MLTDDFLPREVFRHLRAYSVVAEYKPEVNPVDGVEYPLICKEIPEQVLQYFPEGSTVFLRASPQGVYCPHVHHNDASMGRQSGMLYLNEKEQCRGGTALVVHVDANATVEQMAADANDRSKWVTTAMAPMYPNRYFLFDAGLMHRAEPEGGFGTTPEDRRVVLTCFTP